MPLPLYTMPLPPAADHADHSYYQAFVHMMNNLSDDMGIADKLRHAIEHTAALMATSPAHIARLLVDYGLRAPRHAFPDSFLDYVDHSLAPHKRFAPVDSDVIDLHHFWTEPCHEAT